MNKRQWGFLFLAMELVVGLMDDSEVAVFCEQGKYVTAGELRDKVAELIGLDENHRQLFSIWVVSASLRLLHLLLSYSAIP